MWLDVFHDPFAALSVGVGNKLMTMDLFNDGRYHLLSLHTSIFQGAVPGGKVLKIFRGTDLEQELTLPPIVDAIKDLGQGLLAAAGGVNIYLFKHLKPYYKFQLHQTQQDASHEDTITCMDIIQTSTSTSNLILGAHIFVLTGLRQMIGTELGFVVMLDHSATREAWRVEIKVAVQYMCIGEHPIVIVYCRDGVIRFMKISDSENAGVVKELVTVPSTFCCCGMVCVGSKLLVPCVNRMVYCYSLAGKRLYSLEVDDGIHSIASMPIPSASTTLLLVASAEGQVSVFQEEKKIGTFLFGVPIASLTFGKYGTEEAVLCTVLKHGALDIKVLKRNFLQEAQRSSSMVLKDLPKDVGGLVDDLQRDDAHAVFQENLQILKLETIKAYSKIRKDGEGVFSENSHLKLQLNAEVYGLGPKFKILLKITNMGEKPIFQSLDMCLLGDRALYDLEIKHLKLPMLVNGPTYEFSIPVNCKSLEEASSGDIQITLSKASSRYPILSALVKMPVCFQDSV